MELICIFKANLAGLAFDFSFGDSRYTWNSLLQIRYRANRVFGNKKSSHVKVF